jgi:two-component system response regulator AtoC
MRKQILLAEDEVNLRRVLGAQLARDGYDVKTAVDGQEAIAALAGTTSTSSSVTCACPSVDGLRSSSTSSRIVPRCRSS